MEKNYIVKKLSALLFLFLFTVHFSSAQIRSSRRSETSSNRINNIVSTVSNISRNGITQLGGPPGPLTITACSSYTWAQNGQTYTSSGTYFSGNPTTQDYTDSSTWDGDVITSSAYSYFNNLGGISTPPDPIVVNMGGIMVTFSSPNGMYSSGTFIGTNAPNDPITISFSQPIYGIGGNIFTTDIFDTVISGNVTATYSDAVVDSRTVTTDTEFFGHLSATPLTSLVLNTTTTSPDRYISLNNFKIAVFPTLFLTIDTPETPTFNAIAPICSGDSLTLPASSLEGITGTWTPAIDNTTTTTYTFVPDSGQCVTSTVVTLTVTVNSTPPPSIGGDDILVTLTGGCSFISGLYTDDGLLNGKKTYVYSGDPTFHISFDGTKWVLHIVGDLANTGFENLTVPADIYPPTSGWYSTQCPGGTMSIDLTDHAAFCGSATVADLTATGNNLQWYDVATGGTALTNSTALTSGSYYVSQTVNGCESARTELIVTITPSVTPTFTPVGSVCADSTFTLPTTSIEGITGTWSPAFDNTNDGTYTFTPDLGQCVTGTVVTMPITISPAPAGHNAATAINVGNVNYSTTGNNLSSNCFSDQIGEASPDVWYKVILEKCTTELSVNTCSNSDYDTFIRVIDEDGFTELSSNDDSCGLQSSISNLDVYSHDYVYVVVEGYDTEEGNYGLTITQTLAIPTDPTFDAVDPICSGEVLSALPTTSLEGIPGTWSPALDNTNTTTYTFTPDADQCATTALLTITVNQPVTPAFDAVAPICNGDSLSALPTTSNDGITGTWSPALDNTTTTTYTFTADAGQCAAGASLTIIVNQPVTPTFTPVASICNGDPLLALPTTSNDGISGTWSPALDNTTTTTYTFTPDSGQCATTTTMVINVHTTDAPTGNSSQSFDVVDLNDATIQDLVVSPASVYWYASLADAQTLSNPLPLTTVLTNGATYYAVAMSATCPSTPFAVTVTVNLGNNQFDDMNFAYYPNPTSSVVNISYSKNITQLTVVDLIGQIVLSKKTNATNVQIDLSPLAESTYFIRVVADEKEKVIKVVKRR